MMYIVIYSVSVMYSGVSNLVRFSSSWRGVDCAGQHRGLGVHVSFVRSLAMDRWTPTQLRRMVSCHLLSSLVSKMLYFSPCFHSVWDWGPLGVFRFFQIFLLLLISSLFSFFSLSPFSHFFFFNFLSFISFL